MQQKSTRRGKTQENKNVVINKSHSRGILSGISLIPSRCSDLIKTNALCYNNTDAGDPRLQASGMTPHFINGLTTRGFTLIELLVVVLIIGILAAVALPQYQKAVEKSKAVQAQAILPPLIQAYQRYYLEHGTYATKFSDLDVEIPWTGKEKLFSSSDAVLSNQDWSLQLMFFNGNTPTVHIVRLTGPYQNSGFAYFFEDWGEKGNGLLYLPPNSMTCVQKGNSFCTALFKASKQVQSGTAGKYYQMP